MNATARGARVDRSTASGPAPPTESEELAFWKQRAEQLQYALDSRVLIEQAKGILMERFDIPPSEAFELLRRSARSHSMKISVLAASVRASRSTPVEIQAVLVKRGTQRLWT